MRAHLPGRDAVGPAGRAVGVPVHVQRAPGVDARQRLQQGVPSGGRHSLQQRLVRGGGGGGGGERPRGLPPRRAQLPQQRGLRQARQAMSWRRAGRRQCRALHAASQAEWQLRTTQAQGRCCLRAPGARAASAQAKARLLA